MDKIQPLEIGFILHGDKDYEITNVLGYGGCGILYSARSTVMDGNIEQTHEYAIKEYFDRNCCKRTSNGLVELTTDSEELREVRNEFRSEAECLRKLKRHKNIVQVNEVFEENGTFYYVMEYLAGTTLRKYVPNKLSESEAISIVKDIAKALDYLHSEKINHFDVKPDNIMVVNEGNKIRCVLIDFGLSKHFNKKGNHKGKQGYDGASDGYSPKEQYEGIDVFSPSADVYSLAATLFFLLTGHDPCNGKDMSSKYLAKTLPDTINEKIFDALTHALSSDCNLRTQSVTKFYKELTGKDLHPQTSSVATDKFKKKKKKPNNHDDDNLRKIGICIVAVLVVICAVFFFTTRNNSGTKSTDNDSTRVENKDTLPQQNVPEESNNTNNSTQTGTIPDNTNSNEVESNGEEQTQTSVPQPVNQTNNSNTQTTPITQSTSTQSNKPNTTGISNKTISHGTLDLGYATWNGGIKNGKPDGVGKMRFKSSHRIDSETTANPGDVFDGTYTNGHIDDGKLHRSNGEVITIIGEN